MTRRWFETIAVRSIQRAMLSRWLRRLHIADGILWLASIEAEALLQLGKLLKCIVVHSLWPL